MDDSKQGFPRGGKITKLPDKGSTADVGLFQKSTVADKKHSKVKSKKTSRRSVAKHGADVTSDDVAEPQQHEADVIEPLKQEDLEPHMLLLGRVRTVRDNGLLITLPCLLSGFVPLSNISSTYTRLLRTDPQSCVSLGDMFVAGQYVTCMVTSCDLSGHKARNTLSIAPVDVNAMIPSSLLAAGLMLQCSVKSVEDNVFDMDCGIAAVRAVLPRKCARKNSIDLVCGQVLWCVVTAVSVDDGLTTLNLSCEPAKVARAVVAADAGFTPQTLVPGARLAVTVTKVLASGVQLSCLAQHTAVASCMHLDEPLDLPSDYNIGAETHARLLYTLPTLRRTHVTLRAEDSQWGKPVSPRLEGIGQPMEASVIDGDAFGVRLSSRQDGAPLWCPGWSVLSRSAAIASGGGGSRGRWRAGDVVQCWPMRGAWLDGFQVVSMKPPGKKASASGATTAASAGFELGQKVRCSVTSLNDHGCEVTMAGRRGFIPLNHLTNIPLSDWHAKFPIGKKLQCRVLSLAGAENSNGGGGRILLTHNSRLVSGDITLMTPGDLEALGAVGYLCVCRVSDRGVLMTGYNGACAFIPASFVGAERLEQFYVGRLVQCVVENVSVSETATGDDSKRSVIVRPMLDQLRADVDFVGRLMSATVTGRGQDHLLVTLDGGVEAQLPAQHTTDVPEHAMSMLAHHRPGDVLRVVGLACLADKRVVSAKPSFLRALAASAYPQSPQELAVGARLAGCIASVSQSGVRVAFPCAALSKTYAIAAKFLDDGWQSADSVTSVASQLIGRSLVAKLVALPSSADNGDIKGIGNGGRYLFSARFNRATMGSDSAAYVRSGLGELARMVPGVSVGDSVDGQVFQVTTGGDLLMRTDAGRTGVLPGCHRAASMQLKVGDRIEACVVRISPAGQLLLMERGSVMTFNDQAHVARGRLSARIVSLEGGYYATSLLTAPSDPCVVHIATRSGVNDLLSSVKPKWKVGDVVAIRLKSRSNRLLIAVEKTLSDSEEKSKESNHNSAFSGYSLHRKGSNRFPKRTASLPRKPSKAPRLSAVSYSQFFLKDGEIS